MKTLGIASLALSILAASVSVSMAQNYTPTPGLSDVHTSVYGDMSRSHDKAAVVRKLANNGVNARTNQDRTAYEGYYNPQSTVIQPQSANLGQFNNQVGPYYTDHVSSRE